MDIDPSSNPHAILHAGGNGLPAAGVGSRALKSRLSDVMCSFRPAKLFRREDIKEGRSLPRILSLDYDDPGELLMTSESDETIQIYNVSEGRHDKGLISKKYGAKLARFTHTSSSILYASTKQNDAIRYLATHDNSFIRYFEGHEASVTCLTVHPGADNFISCGQDNAVYLWDIMTKQWCGKLLLHSPTMAAYDPSGNVFAIASPSSGSILLYDCRQYDRAPFATIDLVDRCRHLDPQSVLRGWTKLQFSNDGKSLLVGSRGAGHFLLDAFDGSLLAYLHKPEGGTRRLAPGESAANAVTNGRSSASTPSSYESCGDCCFALDGRFVISGSRKDVLVWDLQAPVSDTRVLEPTWVLEDKREAAVVTFNPRYNFFATADQEVLFWLPDPHT